MVLGILLSTGMRVLKAFQEQRSKNVRYRVQFAGHFAHVFVPRVWGYLPNPPKGYPYNAI